MPKASKQTLRQRLDELGLSVSVVARKAAISESTIFQWLNGNRRPNWKLACTVAPLVGWTPLRLWSSFRTEE